MSASMRSMHAPAVAGRRRAYALVLCLTISVGGCAGSSEWVKVRDTPRNPLATTLDLVSPGGPKPTERTKQLLRRYDLSKDLGGDRAALLARLEDIQRREPNREHEYAMAELAYITAQQAEPMRRARALEFYGTSLIHAYRYLFDYGDTAINPYDPQFRGASDLYNQSLEGLLRLVRQEGELQPGMARTIKTANHTCSFDVVVRSSDWHDEDIDRFEFVSEYQVQGLRNHYHDYGLGVPLIAVRRNHEDEHPAEQFYPPNLCFPMTAFLRITTPEPGADRPVAAHGPPGLPAPASALHLSDPTAPRFVLELHDPLERQAIVVDDRSVPLESDLSTPLAYFLNQPQFQDSKISTLGLLNPDKVKQLQGLYMLEPYRPDKMPVVMVHGLWSSPVTWMEMFNDLRSDPLVRDRYQFWFYLYPTGQPFWLSAAQMREDLAMLRRKVDPAHEHPALDQMVLVGHSMGGLVSKLQTVDSDDDFWRPISDHPLADLHADPDVVRSLAQTFFFSPNPSVRRVVTIGTPHRGSEFSNDVTRWLGRKLISLPQRMVAGRRQLKRNNPDFFRPDAPLDIKTSIDSLAPDSSLLSVLLNATPGPWVAYHNVVGHEEEQGWKQKWKSYFVSDGDGVVSLNSARLDKMQQLRSQIIVPADHVSVHRHPQAILEVRRVLLEQLAELQSFPQPLDVQVAQAVEESVPAASPSQTASRPQQVLDR